MDWSVYILNGRRWFDLPVLFFKNLSESCRKKRSNEIAFVVISQQPRSFTLWCCDRSRGRDEPAGQRTCSLAPSPVTGSWQRRMENQKLRELFGACPSPSHPCASPTPADSASQLLCEVGNYCSLSCRKRKWGLRRLSCSPGVPQELCGKAEDEFNPLV